MFWDEANECWGKGHPIGQQEYEDLLWTLTSWHKEGKSLENALFQRFFPSGTITRWSSQVEESFSMLNVLHLYKLHIVFHNHGNASSHLEQWQVPHPEPVS